MIIRFEYNLQISRFPSKEEVKLILKKLYYMFKGNRDPTFE